MKVITFTGWGQSADSLEPLLPDNADVQHIHYQHFEGTKELFPFLATRHCDILVGWSLGGQIAIRATLEGAIVPKLIVLLATPFEFVESNTSAFGMNLEFFNEFEQDFYQHPQKALKKFISLMNKYDIKGTEIIKTLRSTIPSEEGWLKWLRELRYFSCADLDLSSLPKTLVIHGKKDNVVRAHQAKQLVEKLPDCKLMLLEDAGHVPHLHAPQLIKRLIDNEIMANASAEYSPTI